MVAVGEAGADSVGVADTVSVGEPVAEASGGVAVSVGVGVSATNAAGSTPPSGSVPGSSSLMSIPAGWPPTSVPSAFTTRTSTPSDSPVHTDSVPPRRADRSASLPSAWLGSRTSSRHGDQSPVSVSRVRTSGVPLVLASGSSQVTTTALNCSVPRLPRPLRPPPSFSSFRVCTDGSRSAALSSEGADWPAIA